MNRQTVHVLKFVLCCYTDAPGLATENSFCANNELEGNYNSY